MRRALGLAAVFVAGGLAAVVGPGSGCSHEARPVVQPDDPPPLPPASGTPVGLLVDASELGLSADQLAQLKTIDSDLAGHLAAIDASLRPPAPSAAPPPENASHRGRGFGFRAGGATADRQGGIGSRETYFPGTGGSSQPANRGAPAASVTRAAEDHDAVVRDALARALGLLAPGQRAVAQRILSEHGIDASTGGTIGPAPEPREVTEPGAGTASSRGH